MFHLTVRVADDIGVCHWLHNLPADHKCARRHGHNYSIFVTVSARTLTNGMVVDADEVKWHARPFVEALDHHTANEFGTSQKDPRTLEMSAQPTAENIALWIYRGVRPIEGRFPGVRVTRVSVEENRRVAAAYEPDDAIDLAALAEQVTP